MIPPGVNNLCFRALLGARYEEKQVYEGNECATRNHNVWLKEERLYCGKWLPG